MSDALTLPADWDAETGWRGYARNRAAGCYDVRVTVAGKQVLIGSRRTQGEAAALYDLAVWKLCPKISRRVRPNNPATFAELNDLVVETLAPNLKEIYARAAFLNVEDGALTEDELRARHLGLRPVPQRSAEKEFDDAVSFVQRAQVEALELRRKIESRFKRLDKFAKLAGAPNQIRIALEDLETVARCLDATQTSMKVQREYYLTLLKPKP